MLFIELSITEFPVNATPVTSFPSVIFVFTFPVIVLIVHVFQKVSRTSSTGVKFSESSTSISISPFLAYTAILFSPVVIEVRVYYILILQIKTHSVILCFKASRFTVLARSC